MLKLKDNVVPERLMFAEMPPVVTNVVLCQLPEA